MSGQYLPLRSAFLSNKSFNIFWISTIMALMATTLGVVVDGVIVGQMLGPNCYAAVNIVAPILQIFNAIHLIANQYSSIMVSIAIGKRDKEAAKTIFSTAIYLNIILGFIVIVFGSIFMQQIVSGICPNETLRPLVKEYLQIVIWSSPLYLLLPGMCFFTRSDSNPSISTIALVVANVINLFLDIIFIKAGMGIHGSALASSVGFFCGILVTCTHFLRKERIISLVKPNFKKYLKDIIFKAIPFVYVMIMMSVGLLLANIIIMNYLGRDGIITMSVCYDIFTFPILFNMGTNQTMLPLLGILNGLNDKKGSVFIIKRAFGAIIMLSLIYVIFILLFPKTIIGLFGITEISATMISNVRIYSLGLIGFAVNFFMIIDYIVIKHIRFSYLISTLKDLMPVTIMLIMGLLGFAIYMWWSYIIGYGLVFLLIVIISNHIRNGNKSILPLFLIVKPDEDTDDLFNFSVPAKIDGLRQALTSIRKQISLHPNIHFSYAFAADLCCEEIISNIIEHGYKKQSDKHMIDIFVNIETDKLSVCIHDDGKQFNPVKYQDDTTIGLLLIKKLCYSVDYIYSMNQNIVTIVIKEQSFDEDGINSPEN